MYVQVQIPHCIKLSVCKSQYLAGEVEVAMQEAGVRQEGDW